jgi:hypothetical protein
VCFIGQLVNELKAGEQSGQIAPAWHRRGMRR